jgi:uncharacterized protein
MSKQTVLHNGQYKARTLWGTHASGAAFDRKKTPYLTQRAQEFIAQQAMCVIAGLTPHNELDGVLVLGQPGFVRVLDESTCLLQLEDRSRASRILQRLHHALSTGQVAWLGLFFISHPTRERLCVQGRVEMLSSASSAPFFPSSSAPSTVVRLHVREAFFHCSKYIRTQIVGLTVPGTSSSQQRESPQDLLKWNQAVLSEGHCRFLNQQVLCFLCTVNQEGQCAVNHRGGAPGFLVPFLPSEAAPGGKVLLPDFAGNGAFEAIGNILETKQAALVVPNYAAQMALCISGAACVMEPETLGVEVARRCGGAERIITLAVGHIEVQSGDWSATRVYECARAASIWTNTAAASACTL